MTNISQPQSEILLSKEIQKSIDVARNNVTVLTAEWKRLEKLRVNEERVILKLSQQKAYLEDEIKNLENTLTTLRDDKKTISKSINEINKKARILSEEIEKNTKIKTGQEESIKKIDNEYKTKLLSVIKREEEVKLLEEKNNKEKKLIDEVIKNIQSAIKKL